LIVTDCSMTPPFLSRQELRRLCRSLLSFFFDTGHRVAALPSQPILKFKQKHFPY